MASLLLDVEDCGRNVASAARKWYAVGSSASSQLADKNRCMMQRHQSEGWLSAPESAPPKLRKKSGTIERQNGQAFVPLLQCAARLGPSDAARQPCP